MKPIYKYVIFYTLSEMSHWLWHDHSDLIEEDKLHEFAAKTIRQQRTRAGHLTIHKVIVYKVTSEQIMTKDFQHPEDCKTTNPQE